MHAVKPVAIAAVLVLVFFSALSAADYGGDITPPVLVAAASSRSRIDTTWSAQTVTFTLRITDDLAGVKGAHVGLRHENGYNTSRECQNWPEQANRDATLLCAVTWPQYSAEGTWLVTWMALTDGVDNGSNGNVADCVAFAAGRCSLYVYNSQASDVIRSMEIRIEPAATGDDPPLYLPLLVR
jgi:hypothetical protein